MAPAPVMNISVDRLFASKPITEIRALEAQTRGEISGKQEEIRELVGTRYRDLLKCADTLKDMKTGSKDIGRLIENMKDTCSSISKLGLTVRETSKGECAPADNERIGRLHSIGQRMKFLIDAPEQIYFLMESNQYFHAALVYFTASYVASAIESIETNEIPGFLSSAFPLLRHQQSALNHFPSQLRDGARAALESGSAVSANEISCCLAVLVLFREVTRDDAVPFLLESRKQRMFDGFRGTTGDSKNSTSVAATVLGALDSVFVTVRVVSMLFLNSYHPPCPDPRTPQQPGTEHEDHVEGYTIPAVPASLVLIDSSGKGASSSMSPRASTASSGKEVTFQDLGRVVRCESRENSPRLVDRLISQNIVGVAEDGSLAERVRKATLRWLENWCEIMRDYLVPLLEQVQTADELTNIKNAILEKMEARVSVCSPDSQDATVSVQWGEMVCQTIGGGLNLWTDLLGPMFDARSRGIIDGAFSALYNDTSYLSKALDEAKCGYEEDTLWKGYYELVSLEKESTASCVRAVEDIITDVLANIGGLVSQEFNAHIKKCCFDSLIKMAEGYEDQLTKLQEKIGEEGYLALTRIVVLATLCRKLATTSDVLRSALIGDESGDGDRPKRAPREPVEVTKCTERLLSIHEKACKLVGAEITAEAEKNMALGVAEWLSVLDQDILKSKWEAVNVKVSGEDGEEGDDTLRLPYYPSSFIVNVVFDTSRKLQNMMPDELGHSMLATVQEGLVLAAIKIFQAASWPELEPVAIQAWFDLKWLVVLLYDSRGLGNKVGFSAPLRNTLQTLSDIVDPIDWVTMETPLGEAVERSASRHAVMLGWLGSFQPRAVSAPLPSMGNLTVPSIVPVPAKLPGKLQLLPVVQPQSRKTPTRKQKIVITPSQSAAHSKSADQQSGLFGSLGSKVSKLMENQTSTGQGIGNFFSSLTSS